MTEAILIASMLVLFRVTAFIAFMPPINGGIAPATVRLGLAVAMTVLLVPQYAGPAAMAALAGGHSGTGFWVQLAFLTARETAFGAGLAWLFSLTLVPIRVAGAWVAQEMGLTMASLTSPTDHQPSNVVSQSLEAVGVLMFFTLDLHHTVFWILGRTFSLQPVATRWQMPDWEFVTGSVSSSVENGFLMIAPVGIVMFVTLVTLLVTMRTAPQFNFMSYGMAMRVLAGLGGLLLFLPDVCGAMQRLLYRIGMGIIG